MYRKIIKNPLVLSRLLLRKKILKRFTIKNNRIYVREFRFFNNKIIRNDNVMIQILFDDVYFNYGLKVVFNLDYMAEIYDAWYVQTLIEDQFRNEKDWYRIDFEFNVAELK